MEHLCKPCNRCLKRVPMDFKWTGVWPGFVCDVKRLKAIPELLAHAPYLSAVDPNAGEDSICDLCKAYSEDKCSEAADYCVYNEQNQALWHQEPPAGEGYQLWETTSEGSPLSPVFSSLEELCAWASDNTTLFGNQKVSKDIWDKILNPKKNTKKEKNND